MKTIKNLVLNTLVLVLFFAGCSKDNNADNSIINNETVQVKSALLLSTVYSDTLKMVFDTAKIQKLNKYCIKYDKLYHKNDSMFTVHYKMFGDEMYKNGMMMSNYTPSGGMMQGGMMNSGTMDVKLMMSDTAIVGGYYRNMHQLNIKHQPYHNGIYN
jgi:hypothetical protein